MSSRIRRRRQANSGRRLSLISKSSGKFHPSTVLDDFSRCIFSWKLCTTMGAEDVAESSGRRNGLVGRSEKFVKCLCGRFPFECLARPCIEGCRHGGDLIGTVSAEVCALREVRTY